MKRSIIIGALLILVILSSVLACKRDTKTAVPGGTDEQATGLPTVNYGEILSNGFLSERPLTIQFSTVEGMNQIERFRFKWYIDGIVVDTVTGNVLEPQYFRKGARIEAEIVPIDGQQQGTAFRTKPVTIKNSPPVMTAAALRPVPAFVGDTITAAPEATDRDGDAVQYQYLWMVNNSSVPGGENGSFPTAGLKKKDAIAAVVTPFDGEDKGQPMTTAFVVLSNRTPDITSVPSSGLQNGVYVYQVGAVDPDGDALSYSLVSGPSGMTIDRSSGLIRWQPEPVTGKQEMSVKIAVEDAEGSIAYQEFNITLDLK